jgi:hypothetical protein
MSSVQIDQASVAEVKSLLGEFADKYKAVLTTSINKTLGTAKTQATARIGNEINLPAARIKQDFTLDKANYSKLSGGLIAEGEPVGLINFGANQTLKGVSVKVLRSSPRELLKHAYIAAKGTKSHVYWRAYDGPRNPAMATKQKFFGQLPEKHYMKIPVHRLTGPRIEDIFANPKVFDPVAIQAQHVYLQNVEAKIKEIIYRYA